MRSRYVTAFGASIALHLLLAAALAWSGRTLLRYMPLETRRENTTVTFIAPPPEDAAFPGLNPVDRNRGEWPLPRKDDASSLSIDGIKIDVAKLRERARVLFPFVTPGLSLETLVPATGRDTRVSLQNPFAAVRRTSSKDGRPLALSDAALQSLVDKAWARRERWAAFEPISKLAQAHHADEGQLARLLQQYSEQNSLQLYTDTEIRDPRLWAQLGIASDHVTFIAFVRRYASEHPSTRATTELLFLLERLAEASHDALKVLRDSDPEDRLSWTRQTSPSAYELVGRIRRYYDSELQRLGLISDEAITRYYERTRLAILDGIVRTTPNGYRANDARFLMGAIHWRQRSPGEALARWREITNEGGVLVAAAQIGEAVRRRGDAPLDETLRREIDRILKNDEGRWVTFSYDRLRRFGYRFDSF